jgi:hypothetical protein
LPILLRKENAKKKKKEKENAKKDRKQDPFGFPFQSPKRNIHYSIPHQFIYLFFK